MITFRVMMEVLVVVKILRSRPLPLDDNNYFFVIQSEAKNPGFLGKHLPFLHKHRQNMWPEVTPGLGYIIPGDDGGTCGG